MKKLFTLFAFCFFVVFASFSQQKPFLSDIYSYLENTSVFELNQEEGHVPLIPYSTVDQALRNNPAGIHQIIFLLTEYGNSIIQILPKGYPQNFFRRGFNDKKWDTIRYLPTGK